MNNRLHFGGRLGLLRIENCLAELLIRFLAVAAHHHTVEEAGNARVLQLNSRNVQPLAHRRRTRVATALDALLRAIGEKTIVRTKNDINLT